MCIDSQGLLNLNLLQLKSSNQIGSASTSDMAVQLLDLCFDSKAKFLQTLLNQLVTCPSTPKDNTSHVTTTTHTHATNMEMKNTKLTLSQIVLMLQSNIVVVPCLIFLKQQFPAESISFEAEEKMVRNRLWGNVAFRVCIVMVCFDSSVFLGMVPLVSSSEQWWIDGSVCGADFSGEVMWWH